MKTARILFFQVIVFICQTATAQQDVGIKASVDKNKILIGEPLRLTIELTSSSKSNPVIPSFDSIAHFEFLKPTQTDSVFEDGRKTYKTIYLLTSFDSGRWEIPAIIISEKIKTGVMPVDVIFSEFNPQQDYHDIKDIIEVKPKDEKKNWLWYAIAAAIIAMGLIYYLTRRKKQTAPDPPAPVVNAYEEAMQQLTDLQKQSLPGKDFHTVLVEIFKRYVFRKKNIRSQQKTTDDLVMQLRDVIADKEIYPQLQQALRLSDFVKFAKYVPSADDNAGAINSIKKTIQFIEQNT